MLMVLLFLPENYFTTTIQRYSKELRLIASYADDNTIYDFAESIDNIIMSLQK